VNVGEDEPEDIAVRKFMKKVMESGVIEEVRTHQFTVLAGGGGSSVLG
jgi:ribosomal protein S21